MAGSTGISHTRWATRGAPSVFPQVESLPGGRKVVLRTASEFTPYFRYELARTTELLYVAAGSGNSDVLHPDKMGLELRLSVFQEHRKDFLKIVL